jgi:hypothetical protein
VVTGPWDPMTSGATGRGRLRASDADREQVIDALKAAFVQGSLTRDQLSMRVGQAFASRTYAELAVITAGIPAGLIEIQPPTPARARARKRVNKKVVAWGTCAIVLPPALGAAFLTYYGGFLVLFLLAFIGAVVSSKPSAPSRPGPLPLGGRR